jgi:hypothetical protein
VKEVYGRQEKGESKGKEKEVRRRLSRVSLPKARRSLAGLFLSPSKRGTSSEPNNLSAPCFTHRSIIAPSEQRRSPGAGLARITQQPFWPLF